MLGPRENISITLFVDIADKMNVESKSYGPFKVDIPKLSLKDIHIHGFYTVGE